ncbi:MAG: biotin/lipoate--protein ligase family protein [Litorivicinus sp.]
MNIASPQFPPLLRGEAVKAGVDPFDKAISKAISGVDSGQVYYADAIDVLRAALVLAPETTLDEAVQAVYVAQIGLAESLGALAPPEVPIHFVWPDRIKVNGALCGRVRFAADTDAADSSPKWLVIGIDVPFLSSHSEPGVTPDQTTLHDEGCGEITPMALLESWSKHTLLWLTYYLDGGFERVHKEWRPRCDSLGNDTGYPVEGTLVGLDEQGRMLVRRDGITHSVSLIDYAERA